MAAITYQTVKKPIEDRLIDAACVYWNISRTELMGTEHVQRKHIVMYCIKYNTQYTLKEVGGMFGLNSKSGPSEAIDNVEAQKRYTRSVSEAINSIQHIASTLDAEYVTFNMELRGSGLQATEQLPNGR